jgi:carboxyl-terminal processing protease
VPLYLLVDSRTASASEIMAAALQDNGRATLVGPGKTFGKGRIQNVQQLEDGSGVAVTKAKYMTPSGRDIHGVGLTPDVISKTCGASDSAEACMSAVKL